jgi:hypothetical protein
MRKLAAALVIALLAVALHWVAMGLWHAGHEAPFHSGAAYLTCPMGYVCPVSPSALRDVLVAPTPETAKELVPLFLAILAVGFVTALERVRYRPPPLVASSTTSKGLLSVFKKE